MLQEAVVLTALNQQITNWKRSKEFTQHFHQVAIIQTVLLTQLRLQ